MIKKTQFPDLERLPSTNFWKHLLNWVWNKPRITIEELYYKFFFKQKVELEQIKIELEIKNLEIKSLKYCLKTKEVEANLRKTQKEYNFLLERFKI